MHFPNITQKVGTLLADHSTSILTAFGIVGTVGTAVLAGRAGFKSQALLLDQRMEWQEEAVRYDVENDGAGRFNPLTNFDKVRQVWPVYVPAVLAGAGTVTCIFMSHKLSANRIAALAAAYTLSEGRFQEYRDKVATKLTGPKKQALEDEIAQDRVAAHPPDPQVLILTGGDLLCYDMFSDRYFQSTAEKIRKAENKINTDLFQSNYASLSAFYDEIGLKPTGYSNDVGWNMSTTGALELRISTVLSPDDKPCLAFNFVTPPRDEYDKLY